MADKSKKFSAVRMTAATEAAAVQQALDLLGVGPDEVSITIVDECPRGVTVRVGPREDRSPIASPAPVVAAPSAPPNDPVAVAAEEPYISPVSAESAHSDWEDDEETDADAEAMAAAFAAAGSQEDTGVVDDVAEAVVAAAPVRQLVPARPVDPALQEQARALADDFLDRMGLSAGATLLPAPLVEEGEEENPVDRVYLQIEGDDVGILIGKHGQTLQSFQYLLNFSLNNETPGGSGEAPALRVVVDAGGYRARRASALEQAAHQAAARARRDRRAVRMEPMPAHERRLVHLALRTDQGVTTSSEGRDPQRHVVVSPASGSRGGGGGRSGYRPEGGARPGFRGGGSRSGGEGGGRSGGQGGGYGDQGGGYGRSGGFNRPPQRGGNFGRRQGSS